MKELLEFLRDTKVQEEIASVIEVDLEEGTLAYDQDAVYELEEKYPILKKRYLAVTSDGVNTKKYFPPLFNRESSEIISALDNLYMFDGNKDTRLATYFECLFGGYTIPVFIPVFVNEVGRDRRIAMYEKDENELIISTPTITNRSFTMSVKDLIEMNIRQVTGVNVTIKNDAGSNCVFIPMKFDSVYSPFTIILKRCLIQSPALIEHMKELDNPLIFRDIETFKSMLDEDNALDLIIKSWIH